jgi:hypothetical protein
MKREIVRILENAESRDDQVDQELQEVIALNDLIAILHLVDNKLENRLFFFFSLSFF